MKTNAGGPGANPNRWTSETTHAGSPRGHVVLLGDSIFDNKAYVGGEPDVVAQLRDDLPFGWKASLLALDGDVIAGVRRQLLALPDDATHLVISAGGNDALGAAHLLDAPARSVAEALGLFAGAQERFTADYELMAESVWATGLPALRAGGAKIARAITSLIDPDRHVPRSTVIAGS